MLFRRFLRDLSSNNITDLKIGQDEDADQPFANLTKLHDLMLSNNRIERIAAKTFRGMTNLQIL